ncbi:hypothetical protein Lal_00006826 [Lupinus albus]|uniref:Inositol-tetrakisphosphate 1-kinase n=1 Tax=Lupinus albus TaxID=3870 RepID=A0A6A5N128_LUPAL|nr:putative phosphotransferase with an alcohol group as acceptor [Lupinus albus]KAF1876195.1 hypothetical protein Lal_00006826 [Lupinus albus]
MSLVVASQTERHRVGYALETKKAATFIQQSLIDYANDHGIDLIQIDPTKPLLQQGPFRCIIHKLYTQQWINHLNQFSSQNPATIVIDPMERVNRIHNRVSMLEAVTKLQIPLQNATVEVPKQVVLNESKDFNEEEEEVGLSLKFPVIAKPLVANGTATCHELSLVFDIEGLRELSFPVVLQEFVNHGGVVFKIYVAGNQVDCVKRKSLTDIPEEKLKTLNGSVPFSQISSLRNEEGGGGGGEVGVEMPPESLVTELAKGLRTELGLNLFNVDVIRDGNNPTRYLVIDINYFPGYAKLTSYETFITNFLLDVVHSNAA